MASGGDGSVPDGSAGKLFPLNLSFTLSEHCGDSLSLFTLCSCIITVTLLLCINNLL